MLRAPAKTCRKVKDSTGRRTIFSALFALALSAPVVHADTVFSNVAQDCSPCGIAIQGQNFSSLSLAAAFTPGGHFSLTGAKARLTGFHDSTVDFAIFSSSSNLPGLLLATLGSATIPESVSSLFSASGPIPSLSLSSGVEYWLVLAPGTAGTLVAWEDHGLAFQPFAATHDPTGMGHWAGASPQNVQFEIDGTPVANAVPEPGSIWLWIAGIGCARLMGARRAGRPKIVAAAIESTGGRVLPFVPDKE